MAARNSAVQGMQLVMSLDAVCLLNLVLHQQAVVQVQH
jgi:hypothetical protein